jgi:hypothetical protein
VIAPASLISALAFYFGWVFTGSRARYFGLDPSVLDLSGQDYILRSTDALFVPLVALLLTVLVALGLHAIVHGWIEAKRRLDLLRWGARGMLALGTVLLALGLWSMREPLPFPTPFLFAQLSSGLGVAFLGYAVYLGGRLNEVDGGRTYPRPRWLSLAGLVLVVLIIALSLFWAASVYATALGHGGAMDIAANLDGRPAAVVYSKEHLHLAGPGVETGMLPGRHSAYRFRYSGLRLLLRSGGRLFLVPAQWSPSHGSVIVLPESPTIRVEFMTAPASSAAG